ncbi:hypothetical protein ARALYDRAFT_493006, partial [Arabidopsis lyrata subsp. lyrata]
GSMNRSCLCSVLITTALICGAYFIGNAYLAKDFKEKLLKWEITDKMHNITDKMQNATSTSTCQRRPNHSMSLLAMAVGIKQKELVNKVIQKIFAFLCQSMIKIAVISVSSSRFREYEYIFLWDEDLGVGYLSIVKEEGLQISQPALDTSKSEVHHPITARRKKSKFHRRMYKYKGSGRCDDHSTNPPCIGWVEMMAPVFSRAAWRCSWYMIQNDLIHAWGLDTQLGYCAQGDRKKNVGVVDAEYIIHYGLPTLGVVETASSSLRNETDPKSTESSESREVDNRPEVRMKSFVEMKRFKERWKKAVRDDRCWVDPY